MKILVASLCFILASCTSLPVANQEPAPESTWSMPDPTIPIEEAGISDSGFLIVPPTTREAIFAKADASSCAAYKWKSRGKMPAGAVRGLSLMFARSYCRNHSGGSIKTTVMGQPLGGAKDALVAYAPRLRAQGAKLTTESDRIEATYLLMYGLIMRESSGRYCAGRDASAKGVVKSTTAEAGPFQVSANSLSAKGAANELSGIVAQYQLYPEVCELNVFSQGVNPTSGDCGTKSFGLGNGYSFQQLMRSCPAAATEYAATLLRVLPNHWGPVVRGEAEIMNQCRELLDDVRALVDKSGCATVD